VNQKPTAKKCNRTRVYGPSPHVDRTSDVRGFMGMHIPKCCSWTYVTRTYRVWFSPETKGVAS